MRRSPALWTAVAALGFAVLSIPATWPLAWRFRAGIAGDGDPWQWLWGFWWWRQSLVTLRCSPFFTRYVYWPQGIPMWFQCFDIPSATLALPLWGRLPEVAIYNLTLWITYPAAGLAFYWLSVELWGDRLAAFLAGALYTFSAFHFAEGSAHLHLSSIEWSPLYFLGLLRLLRVGLRRDAVLAAAALALATLATPYHLLFCAVGTAALLAFRLLDPALRRETLVPRFFQLSLILAAVYLALAGWFLLGMLRSGLADPILVPHSPERFSADLANFFVPNPTGAWGTFLSGFWRHWSCRGAEAEAYVGFIPLALAVAAAWRRKAARPYLALAVLGAVLALGPYLHVGGRIYRGALLPYGWLLRLLPGLSISGCPNKFSWLATFGVCAAAGAALAELRRLGRRGSAWAGALVALGVLECWPKPLAVQRLPAPPFLRSIALEPGDFAVLDVGDPLRALWHGILHRHPQPGGYVTRPPKSAVQALERDPLLRAFLGAWPAGARPELVAERVERAADLPSAALPRGQWSQAQWEGTLLLPQGGACRFFLEADDFASLAIDGRPVAGGPGALEREGEARLAAGRHALRLLYRREGASPRLRLSWQPPAGPRQPLDARALRALDGRPGLTASYLRFAPELGLPAARARASLKGLRIRYVVTDGWRRSQVLALGLPLAYRGDGIEIYRVP